MRANRRLRTANTMDLRQLCGIFEFIANMAYYYALYFMPQLPNLKLECRHYVCDLKQIPPRCVNAPFSTRKCTIYASKTTHLRIENGTDGWRKRAFLHGAMATGAYTPLPKAQPSEAFFTEHSIVFDAVKVDRFGKLFGTFGHKSFPVQTLPLWIKTTTFVPLF